MGYSGLWGRKREDQPVSWLKDKRCPRTRTGLTARGSTQGRSETHRAGETAAESTSDGRKSESSVMVQEQNNTDGELAAKTASQTKMVKEKERANQ